MSAESVSVCVTGANGFIASHIVKQLLEKGYTVRGTVRDASDVEKYGWLKGLAEGTTGTIELFSADLLTSGSYDEAVAGCQFVCHVAANVVFKSKDPEKEVVLPALEGTRNVLNSVIKTKAARRVVVTSSVATLEDYTLPNGTLLTDSMWKTDFSPKAPYPKAKVLGEKAAWKMYEEQKERAAKGEDGGWSFELCTVLPGCTLGDMLHKTQKSSTQLVSQLLDGTLPLVPDFYWTVVHVKDVAKAHIAALESETAKGRYIVTATDTMHFAEFGKLLKEAFPKCRAPTQKMPNWLLYIAMLFNPAADWGSVKPLLGRFFKFSNDRVKADLGVELIDPKTAIFDTAKSLDQFGIVKLG